MEIFTLIGFAILLALLCKSGIVGIFILACVAVFLWEKFKIAIILSAILFGLYLCIIYRRNKKISHKTPKEQEWENYLNKIREWSRRNKC